LSTKSAQPSGQRKPAGPTNEDNGLSRIRNAARYSRLLAREETIKSAVPSARSRGREWEYQQPAPDETSRRTIPSIRRGLSASPPPRADRAVRPPRQGPWVSPPERCKRSRQRHRVLADFAGSNRNPLPADRSSKIADRPLSRPHNNWTCYPRPRLHRRTPSPASSTRAPAAAAKRPPGPATMMSW
jgi:hypothetical protein